MKAMNGVIQARLWPKDDAERRKALDAGHDLDRVLHTDDLVTGGQHVLRGHRDHRRRAAARGALLAEGRPDRVDRDALAQRHHPVRAQQPLAGQGRPAPLTPTPHWQLRLGTHRMVPWPAPHAPLRSRASSVHRVQGPPCAPCTRGARTRRTGRGGPVVRVQTRRGAANTPLEIHAPNSCPARPCRGPRRSPRHCVVPRAVCCESHTLCAAAVGGAERLFTAASRSGLTARSGGQAALRPGRPGHPPACRRIVGSGAGTATCGHIRTETVITGGSGPARTTACTVSTRRGARRPAPSAGRRAAFMLGGHMAVSASGQGGLPLRRVDVRWDAWSGVAEQHPPSVPEAEYGDEQPAGERHHPRNPETLGQHTAVA